MAFHRMHAYEPPVRLSFSFLTPLGTPLGGRENKLKIASERIAVGTFETVARNPQQSLIVRIVFRRPDVDDDGERPSRYHYEGRSRSRLTRTANLALP